MSDEQFVTSFQANYNRLFNYTGGHDIELMLSMACKYTLANKQFSGVILQKVIEQIQNIKEISIPVSLETSIGYKLAFHLLQQEDRNKEIQRIVENDEILETVKFSKSIYRLIGALFLHKGNLEHAQRAKKLFEEMNQNQRVLTSKESIPYVVFLTANPIVKAKNQADTIMKYYRELRENQFTMGKHLQVLAQIMTIYSADYNEILFQYVISLRDALTGQGIKVKRVHYPYLGVLALAAANETKISEILSLYTLLKKQTIFKNAKDYVLIVAIEKIVQDVIEVQNVIEMTALTNLLEILNVVDFVLEIGSYVPSGISGVLDFFN